MENSEATLDACPSKLLNAKHELTRLHEHIIELNNGLKDEQIKLVTTETEISGYEEELHDVQVWEYDQLKKCKKNTEDDWQLYYQLMGELKELQHIATTVINVAYNYTAWRQANGMPTIVEHEFTIASGSGSTGNGGASSAGGGAGSIHENIINGRWTSGQLTISSGIETSTSSSTSTSTSSSGGLPPYTVASGTVYTSGSRHGYTGYAVQGTNYGTGANYPYTSPNTVYDNWAYGVAHSPTSLLQESTKEMPVESAKSSILTPESRKNLMEATKRLAINLSACMDSEHGTKPLSLLQQSEQS